MFALYIFFCYFVKTQKLCVLVCFIFGRAKKCTAPQADKEGPQSREEKETTKGKRTRERENGREGGGEGRKNRSKKRKQGNEEATIIHRI